MGAVRDYPGCCSEWLDNDYNDAHVETSRNEGPRSVEVLYNPLRALNARCRSI